MGMLVDGEWIHDDARYRRSDSGDFVRPDAGFRGAIRADGSGDLPPQRDRYHLLVSVNCPWAHRTVMMRRLKGLEDVVSLSVAVGGIEEEGWRFTETVPGGPGPEDGTLWLHRVYTAADPGYSGRVTVPVLWDKRESAIVNNESAEIIRTFDQEFGAFSNAAHDYYPAPLRAEIDAVNDLVYENVNNGVYRCGFAATQEAYEAAFDRLFAALDELEARLDRHRYLVGDGITEADVRLFATLVRFDAVYHGHFKCNLRRIADYPNLSNYLRDLYRTPGFGDTCDIEGFKRGYYDNANMTRLNPTRIVPKGPAQDLGAPHDRAARSYTAG